MHNLETLRSFSHHAYALVEAKVEHLLALLKKHHNIEKQGNPDFFHEKYETFGIDESRKLKELHVSKSFSAGSKRIFVLEFSSITHEAQNSLLKIFEEPHEDTHFFIIIPSSSILLPTLRSRLNIIEARSSESSESPDRLTEAQKFLKLGLKEKIEFVDDLAKQISDDEIPKSDAVEFLAALEIILAENPEKNIRALKAILKARDYMNDRSPSVKQLLEFVALSF
jgi:DNA polymerase III delta prime subunit